MDGQAECLLMKSHILTWQGDDASAMQANEMCEQLLAEQSDSRLR